MTMVKVNGDVLIQRNAAEVFAALADPRRIPTWRADILDATALEGHGVGARYRETIAFMGRKTQTFEVVELEPGRALAVQAVDGLSLRPLQRYRLSPEGAATRLHYEVELPVTGGFRLMRPLLARMIPRKWQGYAAALKSMLEAT